MLEDTVHAIASRSTLYTCKYWVEMSGNFSVMEFLNQHLHTKREADCWSSFVFQ